MLNFGPKSSGWLREAGIETLDDVRAIGSVEAYRRVKAIFPDRVTLNMLYALEAALAGIHWTALPQPIKDQLKAEATKDNG
jgi:DNA transformation protein